MNTADSLIHDNYYNLIYRRTILCYSSQYLIAMRWLAYATSLFKIINSITSDYVRVVNIELALFCCYLRALTDHSRRPKIQSLWSLWSLAIFVPIALSEIRKRIFERLIVCAVLLPFVNFAKWDQSSEELKYFRNLINELKF